MSVAGPLDLKPWGDRLAAQVADIRLVGYAAELAAAKGAPRVTPACFLVPVSDQPAQRAGFGNVVVSQNVNTTIAVVTAYYNARGATTGQEAVLEIQALRRAIIAAFLGWKPPGASIPIQYAGGASLPFQDSTVWVSDRLATAYFLRSEISE